MIKKYLESYPLIDSSAYIEKSAIIIGDVHIGALSSVWFYSVIRGDVNCIRIGEKTNIQDGAILHVTLNKYSLHIGNSVTVGHGAILHGCNIKDYCLINIYSNGYLIDFYLYQDNFTDGQEIIIDNFDVWFNINDMATVEILTLDRSMYDFYNTFDMITDREEDDEDDDDIGSAFVPVTTYNPTTNLNNGALGYFGANSIRRYTIRID